MWCEIISEVSVRSVMIIDMEKKSDIKKVGYLLIR